VAGALITYCYTALAYHGYLNPASLVEAQGDYFSMIYNRSKIFDSLGLMFFGLTYMGLPALSHVALFQAFKWCQAKWWLAFLLCFSAVSMLVVLTFQIAPLAVFYLSLIVSGILLKKLSWRMSLSMMSIVLLMIGVLQFFGRGEWSISETLFLIIFRMANSFPFYMSLFPDVLPYTGIDVGQDMIGIPRGPNPNELVFNYMYPMVRGVQGAAPAPAHVAAYAQAGLMFSIFTLVIIGLLLNCIGRLGRNCNLCPTNFALYAQSMVSIYYLTQSTLRDFFLTGYGIVWIFISLGFLYIAAPMSSRQGQERHSF